MEADDSWRAREALRQFKRAAIALVAVGAFWLWLLLGSAGFIAAIFESPKAMVVVLYGGAVLVLVSLLVALTAIMVLLANWPDKSQREAAYSTIQNRASEAVAFVLRQVRSTTGILHSGASLRPKGLSLHPLRAYLSRRLPNLRARLLAEVGRMARRAARSNVRLVQQTSGLWRSFAVRKMPGLLRKNAPLADIGPRPHATASRIQSSVVGEARPAPARTSIPVRRPPLPNRPPASPAAPPPLQNRRDVVS